MAVITERNPKGAGRKGTVASVAERRTLILSALKEGRYWGLREDLAERFGLSTKQIGEDIKAVFAELKEQRLADAEDVKAHLKLRVNDVERKARWGWDHSVGKVLREMVEQITAQVQQAVTDKKDVPTSFTVNLKSAPDRTFLDTILKCIQKEAELEGVALDKPQAVVNIVDWDGMLSAARGMTPEERIAERISSALPVKAITVGQAQAVAPIPCPTIEMEELLSPPSQFQESDAADVEST